MKSIINKIKHKFSKLFIRFVINIVGFIRKHSDGTTKSNIDTIVSEEILRYTELVIKN